MGFCTEDEANRFLQMIPGVEKAIVDSGIILLKYWLTGSPEERTRRLEPRSDDRRNMWELTDLDLHSCWHWSESSRARGERFLATGPSWAPWCVVHPDNKRRARRSTLTHHLS